MIRSMDELVHIQEVLDDFGYQECANTADDSRWYIGFEYSFDQCRIHRKLFMCPNEAAAMRAVRSLLLRTNVYCVTVHSPVIASVVSYYGVKHLAREWAHYYHR